MRYNYYLPFNLNIHEMVLKNPPKFKPFNEANLCYILFLINWMRTSNKDLLFESYSPINSVLLKSYVDNYSNYLKYLIDDLKIIESDNWYIVGEKSKGYRFIKKYQTRVEPYLMKDFIMRKKMKIKHDRAHTSVSELNYLTKWFDDGLEINYSKCKEYLYGDYQLKTEFPYLEDYDLVKEKNKIPMNQFNRNLIAIDKIDKKCYFLKRDENIFRFHSNLTNMSGILRNALTYKGEKLYSIDVKNSQPYLSVVLFNKEFWTQPSWIQSSFNNVFNINKLNIDFNNYIMLREMVETLVDKDFGVYVGLVKNGSLYEYLAKEYKTKLGIEYVDRKQIKSLVFQTLFTSNRFLGQSKAAPKRLFANLFPDVYKVFKMLKKKDKSFLPRLLQSIESYLVIDVICKRIGKELPKAPIFTIHDSIATTKEFKDRVEQIMLDEFDKNIGFAPKLSVEEWCTENIDAELLKLKSKIEKVDLNKKINEERIFKNEKNIVYKVTNKKTKEVYIGASTKSLEDRKKDHIKKSRKGKSYSFQDAIASYGPEAFEWEQIDTAVTTDELAKKEKEYILKYNSKEEGYNADGGGGIHKTVYQYDISTRKIVEKFSNLTDAAAVIDLKKQDLSKVCLSVNKVSKGFVWSYSSTFPKHINDNRKKGVQQYTLDVEFINEYKSVSEASKQTSCNKTSIAKVCRGERKSCGGYFWRYRN